MPATLLAVLLLLALPPSQGGVQAAKIESTTVGAAAEILARSQEPGRLTAADSVLSAPEHLSPIHLRVRVEVHFDSTDAAWTYRYWVTSSTGDSSLDVFAIAPVPRTARLVAPRGWKVFQRWQERDDAAVWTPWDSSPVGSRSGAESLVIVCPAPPTNVRFYAEPYRSTLPEDEGDELVGPTLFNAGVTGIIAGPDTARDAQRRPRNHGPGVLALRSESVTPIGDARVDYFLQRQATVSIVVCDSTGRTIRSLFEGVRAEGDWGALWNGLDDACHPVRPGIYSFRLIVDGRPSGTARVRVSERIVATPLIGRGFR